MIREDLAPFSRCIGGDEEGTILRTFTQQKTYKFSSSHDYYDTTNQHQSHHASTFPTTDRPHDMITVSTCAGDYQHDTRSYVSFPSHSHSRTSLTPLKAYRSKLLTLNLSSLGTTIITLTRSQLTDR